MGKQSFIYRHILIYRFIMDLLYLGKYKNRFNPLIEILKDFPPGSRILELCFGDTQLAMFCRKAGYSWIGLDINAHFVAQARKAGFEAQQKDIARMEVLPDSDGIVIMGSLYHFYPDTVAFLAKMINATGQIILSEPISNLSDRKGIIGFLARRSANAGRGEEKFRYNSTTLLNLLEQNSVSLGYTIDLVKHCGKDIVIKLVKK